MVYFQIKRYNNITQGIPKRMTSKN